MSQDITVTDQFCGAGGSSLGATEAGLNVKMALNHWKLAIETHNTNFPDTDHDCTDISACNPRRYPKTDVLITSPECTNHSLAKGQKRKGLDQLDAFVPLKDDPAAERSRATMWDVPRFAEYHEYKVIIVENVIEARHWIMWDSWIHAMSLLGYDHRCVYLNSMHCHPTPQSRDRMYVVFWKKGNKPPRLDVAPPAFCAPCSKVVDSIQTWKRNSRTGIPNTSGRYKRQYIFTCPECRSEVSPYYYAALNAIDWSLPAQRIGDRARPLKERTLQRIKFGLEKFGREPLVITTNMTTDHGRVRPVSDPGFTQTGSAITALATPFLVETGYTYAGPRRAYDGKGAVPTQSTRQTLGLTIPAPFFATLRGTSKAHLATDPLGAVTAGGRHHGLVIQGAALMTMRDHPRFLFNELTDPLQTQVATATQDWLIQRQPFFVQYYGTDNLSGAADPLPTATGIDRHGFLQPDEDLNVEDCYFRILQPHEIGAAMAFPSDYVVLGNKREKVKQYGNAVTPPAMRWLIDRATESLS